MNKRFSVISTWLVRVVQLGILVGCVAASSRSMQATDRRIKIVVLDPTDTKAFGDAARNGTGIYSDKGFYVCPAFTGYESVMSAILNHVDTDYVVLGDAKFGADKEVQFVHMNASYGISGGFESVYHSSFTLVRHKGAKDWKRARLFLGPEEEIPGAGVVKFLETKAHEFRSENGAKTGKGIH